MESCHGKNQKLSRTICGTSTYKNLVWQKRSGKSVTSTWNTSLPTTSYSPKSAFLGFSGPAADHLCDAASLQQSPKSKEFFAERVWSSLRSGRGFSPIELRLKIRMENASWAFMGCFCYHSGTHLGGRRNLQAWGSQCQNTSGVSSKIPQTLINFHWRERFWWDTTAKLLAEMNASHTVPRWCLSHPCKKKQIFLPQIFGVRKTNIFETTTYSMKRPVFSHQNYQCKPSCGYDG